MSKRRKPELSATQLAASGLATATVAVGTSYLGVAGTLIGAALTSVATTAGASVYQHYLDRGKTRTVTLLRNQRNEHGARTEHSERAEHSAQPDGAETAVLRVEPATGTAKRLINGVEATELLGPLSTATMILDSEAETRLDVPPPDGEADRRAAVSSWRRPRWYAFAGAAVAIFAVVMGGITLVEALANKPVSSMVGGPDRSGTSFGQTFGGGGSAPANEPSTSPTVTPSTSPSGSVQPTTSANPTRPGGPQQPPSSAPPTGPPSPSPAPTTGKTTTGKSPAGVAP
jgi:hypothetical protein